MRYEFAFDYVQLPDYFAAIYDEVWGVSASGTKIIGTYGTKTGNVGAGSYGGFRGVEIKSIDYVLPHVLTLIRDFGKVQPANVYEPISQTHIYEDLVFPSATTTSARSINEASEYGGFYRANPPVTKCTASSR